MAQTRESRKTPRKAATATPKPDTKAAAPRTRTTDDRAAPSGAPTSSDQLRADLSSEETRRQIAEAAYYRAKERGFEPGHELEDWIEAEAEVMARLNERQ